MATPDKERSEDKGRYQLQDKISDASTAWTNCQPYFSELKEIYRYFTPFRQSTAQQQPERGGASPGQKRTDYLFDGTGPSAAFSFASNMKADWMPAFEDFFKLENGPLYEAAAIANNAGDQAAERNAQLQLVARVVHGLTSQIRATATDEMFTDLFAGTGCMVLNKGSATRDVIRGFSVPITEIALENGPYGGVARHIWKRNYKARLVEEMWPNNFGKCENLAKTLKDNRNADVAVTQYHYWDHKDEVWRLCVWTDKDADAELHCEKSSTSAFITPRMFVVPGEAMGRGIAHLGLPFVKTANKARELALRAAAFALLGLWTRRDDRVFNPDLAPMVPGAMWKVGSNGGSMGPTIQRLDVPKDFDISTIIINDERDQIRRVLLDDELPELTDRVRSPTEIAGRMRRYDRNRGGATTRLAFELIAPFVQRSVDILGQHGKVPANLKVDDIITRATVTAPAAAAQKTDKVERTVSWLQMMAGLMGPQFMGIAAKVEDIFSEMGRDLGIDERFIRKTVEADYLKQLMEQVRQETMQAMKGQPEAPAPQQPEVAPEQQYMNGGM